MSEHPFIELTLYFLKELSNIIKLNELYKKKKKNCAWYSGLFKRTTFRRFEQYDFSFKMLFQLVYIKKIWKIGLYNKNWV